MEIRELSFRRAADAIKRAEALLITAGAGMGVDSGLPDFRGQDGFWRAYPPIARLGKSFYEMANPRWFDENPGLAWAFYGHRMNLYRRTAPHGGFGTLLAVGREKKGGFFVFTSNVDGQFQKADFDESRIDECHGSIHYLQCVAPCGNGIWTAEKADIVVDEARFIALEPLPRCIHCGGLARPNVLMFGDWRWISDRTEEQERRFVDWLREVVRRELRLAVVEIGAGEAVPTVRRQSEHVAESLGATLIRINPREPDVSSHDHISIDSGAAEALEAISRFL
ncbi:MAG: NAD-dependent deacetylase [Deltaproteobacteria bacterium]|nr:NAD-dependent deacetylase [Deltaproteobacteria bacterium]